MIIVFTSNFEGGIVQFAIQLSSSLQNLGEQVICYLPNNSIVSLGDFPKDKVFYYEKTNTINLTSSRLQLLAVELSHHEPEFIWFVDEAIICSQLIVLLEPIKSILTIHDPLPHPTNSVSVRQKLHDLYSFFIRKKALKRVQVSVLLSENSLRTFLKGYNYHGQCALLPLGAHVPKVIGERPNEIDKYDNFFLFFGRIDKYKNISILIRAYMSMSGIENITPLVIAGKGRLTDEENSLIAESNNIILINRYISDSEMVWLFSHANSIILPYLEATQSGVIPIAYHFGVPVITSNVEGLSEFVENGRTGFVCNTIDDYKESMIKLSDNTYIQKFKPLIKSYYENRFNWSKNLTAVLDITRNKSTIR